MKEADALEIDGRELTPDQVKSIIKCIHKKWYSDDFKLADPSDFLFIHRHLGGLFNYAGITETLVENNPGETTPDEVEAGIKSGKYK
jgi:hypothetical protein